MKLRKEANKLLKKVRGEIEKGKEINNYISTSISTTTKTSFPSKNLNPLFSSSQSQTIIKNK